MKLSKYFSEYSKHFGFINRVFLYPHVFKEILKGGYDVYWDKRTADKDIYRFSLSMKWWEKLFSLRYQKSLAVSKLIEPGSDVLDIGCGDGLVLSFLKKQKNINGIGVDISKNAVAQLRKMGFKGMMADLTDKKTVERLPKTDYILLLDVIEHLQYPEQLLLALKNKFRKGIIVNIPNTGHYTFRLRLLFGRTPAQWLYYPGEHIRYWSITDFKWWCKLLDLKIIKHRSTFGTFGLQHLWPNMFSTSQVFLIKNR